MTRPRGVPPLEWAMACYLRQLRCSCSGCQYRAYMLVTGELCLPEEFDLPTEEGRGRA